MIFVRPFARTILPFVYVSNSEGQNDKLKGKYNYSSTFILTTYKLLIWLFKMVAKHLIKNGNVVLLMCGAKHSRNSQVS